MKFSLAAVVGGTMLLSFGVTALPVPALDTSANPEKVIDSRDIPVWTKFKEKHYSPSIEFKGNWDERDKHEIERAFEWWKRDENNEAPAIVKREAKIPDPDYYRPSDVIDVDGEKYTLASDEKKNGRWSYTKEAKPWDDPAFWRKSSWGKRSEVVSDGESFEKRGLWNFTKSLIGGRSDDDSSLEKRSTQIGLPKAEKEILSRKAPPTENGGKGPIIDYGGSRQGSLGSFGSFGSGGGSFSSGGGSFSRGGPREGSYGSFGSFGSQGGEEEEFEKRDSPLVARKAPPKENGGYGPIIDYGGSRQGSFGSFGSGGGSFSGGSREGSFGSFGSEGGEGEDFEEYEKRDGSVVARKAPSPPSKGSYGSYSSVGGGSSFSSGGGSFSSGSGSREGSFGSFGSEGGEGEEEEEYDEYEKRALKQNNTPTSSSSSELSQPSWDDYEQPFEFLDEKRSIWDHDFQNVLDDPVGALKNATASKAAVEETATEKRAEAESSE